MFYIMIYIYIYMPYIILCISYILCSYKYTWLYEYVILTAQKHEDLTSYIYIYIVYRYELYMYVHTYILCLLTHLSSGMIADVIKRPTHSVLQHKASAAGTLHTAGRVWGALGRFIKYSRPPVLGGSGRGDVQLGAWGQPTAVLSGWQWDDALTCSLGSQSIWDIAQCCLRWAGDCRGGQWILMACHPPAYSSRPTKRPAAYSIPSHVNHVTLDSDRMWRLWLALTMQRSCLRSAWWAT